MYYLVYGLFYLLSLLPLWLLYGISDLLYGLTYYVLRYRRRVVMDNLRKAFPEKQNVELVSIAKKFYRSFIDNFIEMLKLFSATDSFIRRHFQFDNIELIKKYLDQGRKIQFHLGHTFNWEMANMAFSLYIKDPVILVYMPLGNKIFERLLVHLRTRKGSILVPATDMKSAMIPYRQSSYLLALVADQAPGNPSKSYWLNFFGRPTPMVQGPERGAKRANAPSFFCTFYKVKRGYYRVKFNLISDKPSELPEGKLTKDFAQLLEDDIRQYPDIWLWSHRRWKHEWKEEYNGLWIDTAPLPNS